MNTGNEWWHKSATADWIAHEPPRRDVEAGNVKEENQQAKRRQIDNMDTSSDSLFPNSSNSDNSAKPTSAERATRQEYAFVIYYAMRSSMYISSDLLLRHGTASIRSNIAPKSNLLILLV